MLMERNWFKMAPETGADGSAAAAANAGSPAASTTTAKAAGSSAKVEEKKGSSRIQVIAKAGGSGWFIAFSGLLLLVIIGLICLFVWAKKAGGEVSFFDKAKLTSRVEKNEKDIIANADKISSLSDQVMINMDDIKSNTADIKGLAADSKQLAEGVLKNSQAIEKNANSIDKIADNTKDIAVQQKKAAEKIKESAADTTVAVKEATGAYVAGDGASGANVSGPVFSASGAGVDTSNVFNTPVTEIRNNLDKDLYVIFYGDWDGGMMAKIAPGQALKPGFKFENGKTFRPGVHFSVFSLDNVKKDGSAVSYDLNDLFTFDQKVNAWRPSNTSLGTYYWASGSITVRDGYYKSAMSILAADGKIYDGVAVKRANGTTKAVKSGGVTIAALNM